MPVTLRDVASRAGVSPVVVSRVLHQKALSIRVSEATAERVRQAAHELGYRCNVMARNFRAQQTMSIGVLHGVGTTRPRLDHGSRYFAALMDGLVEGAFQHGYSVTLCPKLLGHSPGDAMSDGRFDGLVWYSSVSSDENLQALASSTVPLVLLHARSSDFGGRHASVICDNDQGMGLAVDHLVSLGHRRIAFAMDVHPLNVESLMRLEALKRHMQRHGLSCNDEDVLEIEWSRENVSDYLSAGPRHTAIIANNDGLAVEFMTRAQKLGIRVPDDLSVVGFDSTSYCEELRPTLTSVYQPLGAMGAKAIDLLVDRIKGERTEPHEVVFPCSLDVRGSTMPHKEVQP
jgi:DNA-binding LacI/PurR family transcriptional regulator